MSKATRVEFRTADGITLRGDYHQAEGDDRPVVVMTAGLHLLKEHFIDAFARRFQAEGMSALTFDYRNYGSSDGLPRYESDLMQQAEDYRDAVTAAMSLPGADPRKIVLWGVGHGGAAALIAAADDPRPKAVVLQSPIISGRKDSEAFPKGFLQRAWRDREDKTRTGDTTPTYVQVWPESIEQARGGGDPVVLQHEAAFAFISEALPRSEAAGTPWENKLTLRSLLHLAQVEGRDFIHKIEQPTLYAVFPEDPFTGTAEYHRTAFDRMGPNGEFQIVAPPENVDFETFLTSAGDAHVAFLKRVL